jgi:Protein of unknown function (DUF2637)
MTRIGRDQRCCSRARVRRRVSERDLNPCSCELRFCRSLREERRITAGQARVYVSEARVAPYVHDQHQPDHGVCADCWRCAMSGADRVIRWSTAFAVLGVAAVAAVASYEHAYDLVRAHGEAGWTARPIPLTVDGLIYASSMVMLDSARRKTPGSRAGTVAPRLGYRGDPRGQRRPRPGPWPDRRGRSRVAGSCAGRLV